MGAWGTGPFDSDSALDWFGDLARTHARLDDDYDYDIVPGSVDVPAVTRVVRSTLTGLAGRAPDDDTYAWHTAAEQAYFAAGLVAAVLSGQPDGATSNTRLGEAIAGLPQDLDPLGLSNHCGHAALLDRAAAEGLREDAAAAVTDLRSVHIWHEEYVDPDEIRAQLDRLQAALAAA